MDALSLLDQANASGLDIELAGDDLVLKGPRSCSSLVVEIGKRKQEVIVELRARASTVAPVTWNHLAGQRWSEGSSTPGLDVPADWRWDVASWPIQRWIDWRRRGDIRVEPSSKLAEIRAAERRAFDELLSSETNIVTDHSSAANKETTL